MQHYSMVQKFRKIFLVFIISILCEFPSIATVKAEEITSATNEDQEELINLDNAWDLFSREFNERSAEAEPVNLGIIDTVFAGDQDDLKFAEIFYNYTDEEFRTALSESDSDDKRNQLLHGTHVAGIAGAIYGNNLGIDGAYPLAYDKKNDIRHLYAASTWGHHVQNHGNYADMYIDCLDVLLENNVKVINISLTDNSLSDEEKDSVGEAVAVYLERMLEEGKDFLLVVCAGNGADVVKNYVGWETESEYASAFTCIKEKEHPEIYKRIIVAGSCDWDGVLASYSMAGDRTDLYAPGDCVSSTIINNEYEPMSGTSQATPYVSGTAAMLWTLAPDLSGNQIKNILTSTVNWSSQRFGWEDDYPVLDAYSALKKAIKKEDEYLKQEQNITGLYEISNYFDSYVELANDWSLSKRDGVPNLGFNDMWDMTGFILGTKEISYTSGGPAFLFVNYGASPVTLYGVELAENYAKLDNSLDSHGWTRSEINKGYSGMMYGENASFVKSDDTEVIQYWYTGSLQSESDTYLIVTVDMSGKILYWYMTNDGMITNDGAVDSFVLGYEYEQ